MESVWNQGWFWLFVFGVVILIGAFIIFAVNRDLRWWFWGLLILGIIIMIIALMWWLFVTRSKNTLEEKVEKLQVLPTMQSQPVVNVDNMC